MTIAPAPIPQLQRLPAHKLALWLAGPVAAIIVVSLLAAAWIVSHAADQIDEILAQKEVQLAKTAFETETGHTIRMAIDYAAWEDVYDQFNSKLDLAWTEENLGPYISKTFGIDYTFVFDKAGMLRYAAVPNGDEQEQFTSDEYQTVRKLNLERLRGISALALAQWTRDAPKPISGYIQFQNTPAFVAMEPIHPAGSERLASAEITHTLVVVKLFNSKQLNKINQSYRLTDLSVHNTAQGARLELPSIEPGAPPFGATWTSVHFGAQFSWDSALALLPLGLVAMICLALAGLGWWRAVTSIRDAELQALADRARSVQETSRAKSLFVANMSHELRTPLNAIIGFSEVIKTEMLGAIQQRKYVEYAADVHASGKHLLGIVNNILTLSKIEAQQQRIQIEDVSVAEAVSEVLRMTRPDAGKREVEIETQFDGVPVARADVQALKQIAVNLLSNAIKFSDPGSAIRLSVRVVGDRVHFTVEDRGCGIPEETLAQLGRPFTQAEDPYRRNYQGTGLGLSICFALARAMDGELRITSHPGEGTVATLDLPVATSEPKPAQHAA